MAELKPLSHDALRYLETKIREVPDFPKPGIRFKDITPLLADARAFHLVVDAFAARFLGERVDAIVGVESRGFLFGAPLALRLNAAFVPVRKPGKLPWSTDRQAYALEYGEAELHMHTDGVNEGARVIVVDDLLATGGTARAAGDLVRRQKGHVLAYAFVIELGFLGGRARLFHDEPTEPVVFSILGY